MKNSTDESQDIYNINTKWKIKFAAIAVTALTIGVVLNFPLNNFIVTQVSKVIVQNQRSCPMTYDQIRFSLLLFPTLALDNLNIDGRCFGQQGNHLKLGNSEISFMGPHFIPFGARLHAKTNLSKAQIPIRIGVGIGSTLIKIPETDLSGKDLINLFGGFRSFEGNIKTEVLLKISENKIQEGNMLLESSNFKIPAQNIMGLAITDLYFGVFAFKVKVTSATNAEVENIVLGNERSPLFASIKGKINLIQPQLSYSSLDLAGQVRFSDEFIKQFPIINLLISGKKANNGIYAFSIKGSVGSPQFKFN